MVPQLKEHPADLAESSCQLEEVQDLGVVSRRQPGLAQNEVIELHLNSIITGRDAVAAGISPTEPE
jgi:hypothetical protein